MRNLKVVCEMILKLENFENRIPSLKSLQSKDLDCLVTDESLFCLRIKNKVYCLKEKQLMVSTLLLEHEMIMDSTVVGFEFCRTTKNVYVAYSCGNLFTLDTNVDSAKLQYGTKIDDGIRAMKLSPNGKDLVLLKQNNTVVLMKHNFKEIKDLKLDLKAKSSAPVEDLGPGDNVVCQISWHGYKTSFTVYFSSKINKTLNSQVYNRTGDPKGHRYNKTIIFGQGNLKWGPSASAIAATHGFQNNYMISYFEEDSLEHTDISTLCFQPEKILVKDLQWSTDEDVLAIWCVNVKDECRTSRIQLWTEKNNHLYLKQTLSFPAENPILYLTWGSNLKLYICTEELFLTYEFIWTVSHSCGTNETDKAVVGVIDGDRALLTAFRQSVFLQPPIADQALGIGQPIHEIVFAPDVANKDSWINSNVLFTVLHGNQLAFYKQESKFVEYAYIKSYEIEWKVSKPHRLESIPYSMYNFFWYKEDTILCTLVGLHHRDFLCVIHIDGISPQKNGRLIVQKTHEMNDCIQHIVRSPNTEIVYIITKEVLTYNRDCGIKNAKICVNNFVADHIEVIEVDDKHIIAYLSGNLLYFNGEKIASNITSFLVHARFLLLTTTQHTLINIALDTTDFARKLTENSTTRLDRGVGYEKFFPGLSIRKVNNGSRLIMAIPKDTGTILQTESRKVECIRPGERSIIHMIGTYLDELNYRAAFDLIIKQRIDSNLIFDHNPDLFIAKTEKFIGDINDPDLLNLFLSNLQKEDVTSTIYSRYYSKKRTEKRRISSSEYEKKLPTSKVKYVCDLLRNKMESRPDASKLLLPILTSIVQKKPESENLKEALKKVKTVEPPESQEKALEHLIGLVDNSNMLRNVALGMYDLPLAELIAIKSQKNSQEFLPQLNTFKSLDDEHYRCFCIDKYLKRCKFALNHISKCDDRFDECIAFIQSQNLYREALKLYPINSEQHKKIAELFGDRLMDTKKFLDAAKMYMQFYCNDSKILDALKQAKEMNPNEVTDVHSLYNKYAKQLMDIKKYANAANIYTKFLNKPKDAISALCDGKLWDDAFSTAHQSKNLEIIETLIIPTVQKCADSMFLKISDDLTNLKQCKVKLAKNLKARISSGSQSSGSSGKVDTPDGMKRRKIDCDQEDLELNSAIQKIRTTTNTAEVNALVKTLRQMHKYICAQKLEDLQQQIQSELASYNYK